MAVGKYAGIHFGYRENNTSYRKSAIVFERTDLLTGNAQGKVHILNGPQAGAGSATLADSKLTINEYGNVGISTTSPAGFLEINGGTGVATSGGTLIVRQDGDSSNDGIALTSSQATSHRIWKDVNGGRNS